MNLKNFLTKSTQPTTNTQSTMIWAYINLNPFSIWQVTKQTNKLGKRLQKGMESIKHTKRANLKCKYEENLRADCSGL